MIVLKNNLKNINNLKNKKMETNLRVLEVINVEEGTPAGPDTKTPGRKSLKVTFAKIDKQITVNGKTINVKSNSPSLIKQLWEDFVAPDGTKYRGDTLMTKGIIKGDLIEGSIEERTVEPYTIGEGEKARKVNVTRIVCFGDDIDREFDRAGHKAPNGQTFVEFSQNPTAAEVQTAKVEVYHEVMN